MQELTSLHNKLDALLKNYATLQAENSSLKETVSAQKSELNKLNGQVQELEGKLSSDATANALAANEGTTAIKKQLNGLIKDIDKLVATLND